MGNFYHTINLKAEKLVFMKKTKVFTPSVVYRPSDTEIEIITMW